MFEGIPGSGKTTTSQLLYDYLLKKNIKSELYVEGCNHPIDLPFYAYLSKNEFTELLLKYPQQEKWLYQNSISEDDYFLTPYKVPEPNPRDDMLEEYLGSKEFCYSSQAIVDFNTFKNVFYKRFENYVATKTNKDSITIFESVLFQHQIHDINRLYPQVDHEEIIDYICKLANILLPLNPVLFYISQNSVKDSLECTARIRSKPSWSYIETIKYYIERKELELNTIKVIPFKSIVIDNTNQNWGEMFRTILNVLSIES